jgi:hypothetical protein
MKTRPFYFGLSLFLIVSLFTMCSDPKSDTNLEEAGFNSLLTDSNTEQLQNGGYESQIKYGEHLVLIVGCHDCHSPKKMTPQGPQIDFSKGLSGHPANSPAPKIDRKMVEEKGLAVTDNLTAWIGPWGISYAANLTSDKTGIGNWQEKNFITAMREGKHKGISSARTLLPPMPWEMYKHMTDEELKAIFAYLKSTKPINNVVPAPEPPLSASGGSK